LKKEECMIQSSILIFESWSSQTLRCIILKPEFVRIQRAHRFEFSTIASKDMTENVLKNSIFEKSWQERLIASVIFILSLNLWTLRRFHLNLTCSVSFNSHNLSHLLNSSLFELELNLYLMNILNASWRISQSWEVDCYIHCII